MQPLGWVALVAVLPATWVAWDSTRIGIRNYHTSLDFGPGTLFVITLGAWIVVLPWYLAVRDLIREGKAIRRDTTTSIAG